MGRSAFELGEPIGRALKDIPLHLRAVRGVTDNLKVKKKGDRTEIKASDKFDDKPGPVKEFDTGSYKDLKSRETVGDKLQHDHIPSSAALRRAKEIELNRDLTRKEMRDLHNDAASVELSDLLHSQSRTYGGKNSQAQINLDASDLKAAMERDLATLKKNLQADGRLSPRQIDSLLNKVRDLNLKRGIR